MERQVKDLEAKLANIEKNTANIAAEIGDRGSVLSENLEPSQQEEILKEELTKVGNFILAYERESEEDPTREQLW